MRASWIRVSALVHKDDKIAGLPSDAARFAWIVALCEGKLTKKPGAWESEAHFRASLGGRSRWLGAFVSVGLMEQLSSGAVRVKNWERWQSDPTARERKERYDEKA